jgi:hypothetical protein
MANSHGDPTSDLLRPRFKTKVEFAYGDVFDPDDPVARWASNLARAVNDLLLANYRLENALANGESNHETVYDIKSVIRHAWELAKFLQESERSTPQIKRFVEEHVPKQARDDYTSTVRLFQPPAPGDNSQTKSFKNSLISARDQASHYIDGKVLRQAMARLGRESDGEPNTTASFQGETFKDFYAEFASALDMQMIFPIEEDQAPFKRFAFQTNELTGRLIRYAGTAVDAYLAQHEDALTISQLNGDPGQGSSPAQAPG